MYLIDKQRYFRGFRYGWIEFGYIKKEREVD